MALVGAKPLSDKCWVIVNWTIRNKIQWNISRNWNIFIQGNAFENVWQMAAILSRPQMLNQLSLNFFHGVLLALVRHWLRQWFGTERTPSHSLNQWWPDTTYANMSAGLALCQNFSPVKPITSILFIYGVMGVVCEGLIWLMEYWDCTGEQLWCPYG